MKNLLIIVVLTMIFLGMICLLETARNRKLHNKMQRLMELQEESIMHYEKLESYHEELLALRRKIAEESEQPVVRGKAGEFDTGFGFLDYVLEKQRLISTEHGIDFCVEADRLEHFPCSELDTISLLDNLLENAREACEHAQTVGVQNVHIKMQIREKRTERCVWIELENSKDPELHPAGNNFETTKGNALYHGKGTHIVCDIVDRYGGTLRYADKEEYLTCSIQLRWKEECI